MKANPPSASALKTPGLVEVHPRSHQEKPLDRVASLLTYPSSFLLILLNSIAPFVSHTSRIDWHIFHLPLPSFPSFCQPWTIAVRPLPDHITTTCTLPQPARPELTGPDPPYRLGLAHYPPTHLTSKSSVPTPRQSSFV